jgi:hypothetical protein
MPPLLSSSSDILRLSDLVRIIKDIVGRDKCKLNIIDYSCSKLASSITEAELPFARYTQSMDIENRYPNFEIPVSGGKNAHNKRRTHRRFAKRRYTKKRHRKNKASKTSNNQIQKNQHKNT